jgi:hypothetical protein
MAPPNRDVEDYYLKGRFYSNRPTPEGLNLAVDCFGQAMVHDPKYADAGVVVEVRGHLRVWKLPVITKS